MKSASRALIYATAFSYFAASTAALIGYPALQGIPPTQQAIFYFALGTVLAFICLNPIKHVRYFMAAFYGATAAISFAGIQRWINYNGSSEILGPAMAAWDLALAVALIQYEPPTKDHWPRLRKLNTALVIILLAISCLELVYPLQLPRKAPSEARHLDLDYGVNVSEVGNQTIPKWIMNKEALQRIRALFSIYNHLAKSEEGNLYFDSSIKDLHIKMDNGTIILSNMEKVIVHGSIFQGAKLKIDRCKHVLVAYTYIDANGAPYALGVFNSSDVIIQKYTIMNADIGIKLVNSTRVSIESLRSSEASIENCTTLVFIDPSSCSNYIFFGGGDDP